MIRAYDESYLVHSARVLGWMLDSAVNLFGMEADAFWRYFLSRFCEHLDGLYRAAHPESRLKAAREMRGMTQEELSATANVPIRMLQHYEQRVKALSKAAFDTVYRLAHALHVPLQSIVEPS